MKNKILLLFTLATTTFMSLANVSASTNDSTLVRDKYDDVYAVADLSDRTHLYNAERLVMNGRTAYCIELGTPINSSIYSSTSDLNVSQLSGDVLNYVKLVAYYGYDYVGHQTRNYYLAAQELIWERISGRTVRWVTELSTSGPELNVNNEKNEITNLINNHDKAPSFNGQTIELNIDENKNITDTNGILSRYNISNSNGLDVSKNGNTLTVKGADTRSTKQIVLTKQSYTDSVIFVYYTGSGDQKMISSGRVDMPSATVNIMTVGGSIEIQKLDKDTGNNPQGEATLNSAKYGVYNSNNQLVDTLITGEKNRSKDLPYDNYYLKEIEPSEGYELDSTIYNFTLNSNSIDIKMDVYEKVIEREIELAKVYASDETKIMTPEAGVTFGFYNNKGEKVAEKTTDFNGKINLVLPYGRYTAKQLNTTNGYEKVKDFTITVKTSGEKFYYTISNAEVSARIKIVKVDNDTNEIITKANATFRIKNLDTGEYVKQKVTYPNIVVYEEFKSNSEGWLITPYPITSGRYLIEEVTAPEGYTINKEGVKFTIDENTNISNDELIGNYIEIKFNDQEVLGTIEITKTGDMLVGIDNKGNFIYESKNLTGVEFEVYADEDIYTANGILKYHKGDLVETISSNENGIAKTSNLFLGRYCLKEIKTLDGYKLDGEVHCYDLKYKDQYTELIEVKDSIYNSYKLAEISLLKYGQYFNKMENGKSIFEYKALTNVEFGLYAKEDIYAEDGTLLVKAGELIKTYRTNSEGKISILEKLPFTSYFIKEINAPKDYILNDKEYDFVLNKDFESVDVIKVELNDGKPILNDIKKGHFIITKVDSNGEKLSGVEFTIYGEDKTTIIYKGVTNKDGIIGLELPYGKYYYQETKALDGYQLDGSLYEFKINDDSKDISVEMSNKLIPVPNTGIDFNLLYIPVALILVGVGFYFISRRRGN